VHTRDGTKRHVGVMTLEGRKYGYLGDRVMGEMGSRRWLHDERVEMMLQ